ncbi:MAG: galactitol-1-phosphate 5-dehydrogenase [Actinomycetota bacterium]
MSKKMKAAVLHSPGDLRIESVEIPSLGPDDVLVKVSASGICGSDIPRVLTQGTYHFPTIPGHEFGGSVVEVGNNVNKTEIGQRVAVIPLIPCRTCKFCEIGMFAQCEKYGFLGSRDDGGFAEYVKVPIGNIVHVPQEVNDEAAAMLEPISVGLHLIQNVGVNYGDNVLVFGLGAIGNFIAQWAKAFGAKHVFAVDVIPEKIKIAKQVGLEDSVVGSPDFESMIMEKTDGIGADVAIEAAGSTIAFSQAIALLRSEGRLGLVGRPVGGMTIEDKTYEKILRGQISIKGTWSFEFKRFPHHAWVTSIEAIKCKNIITEPLITHRFPIEKTFEAIKMMNEKTEFISKILIKP